MTIDAAALKVLRGERWPGNVRQLQNVVERLVVLSDGPTITEAAVRAELSPRARFITQSTAGETPATGDVPQGGSLADEVREAERAAFVRALKEARGNRTLAARLLGVSRSTFYAKLGEHGLG
jgi:two-component system response regulator AtoC